MIAASTEVRMSHRFHWLKGDSSSQVAPWDVDLTKTQPFATVPSKGAIVDGWLLTLPRAPVLNISLLNAEDRRALLAQARETAIRMDGSSRRTTFFEHGPIGPNTPTGCGVDHAHLHAVPLSFDLLAELPAEMDWRSVDPEEPWETLGTSDYLVVGLEDTWVACEPPVPQSQFFRRRIAQAETHGYGWNHNDEPWTDNVRRTIASFAPR